MAALGHSELVIHSIVPFYFKTWPEVTWGAVCMLEKECLAHDGEISWNCFPHYDVQCVMMKSHKTVFYITCPLCGKSTSPWVAPEMINNIKLIDVVFVVHYDEDSKFSTFWCHYKVVQYNMILHAELQCLSKTQIRVLRTIDTRYLDLMGELQGVFWGGF